MKISNVVYKADTSSFHACSTNFKGIVNGKYYDDEIIRMAKQVMKNPSWQKDYNSGRFTLPELVKDYFDSLVNVKNPTTWGRYGLAFVTMGVSELFFAGIVAAGAVGSNLYEDIKMNKIKNCIVDLVNESDGNNI